MRIFSVIIIFFLFSCGRGLDAAKVSSEETKKANAGTSEAHFNFKEYISQKWHFSVQIPENFAVVEGSLPDGSPVINIVEKNNALATPIGISNQASRPYIAIFPEGVGNETPGGPRIALENRNKLLPVTFSPSLTDSYFYLLENKQPWALSLKFNAAPVNWSAQAEIFVVYKVNSFTGKCFSSITGEEISMDNCNAMKGDTQRFYGTPSEEKKRVINGILESFYFRPESFKQEAPEQIIKVENPEPGAVITSPLIITGKAKGIWFFEADAPLALVGDDSEFIAHAYIQAKGDWMTTDWVDFEGKIEFKTNRKRGQLILSRANPSDKPDFDRQLRIPVLFE